MGAIDTLCERIPAVGRDIECNLQALVTGGSLEERHRWGVLVASAIIARHAELRDAIIADATHVVDEAVIDDARAAAALVPVRDLFYRFRRLVEGDPAYAPFGMQLRTTRMLQPRTSRLDFELDCLAVSVLCGVDACIVAHERALRRGGMSAEELNDAVRIAVTVNAAAIALELGGGPIARERLGPARASGRG